MWLYWYENWKWKFSVTIWKIIQSSLNNPLIMERHLGNWKFSVFSCARSWSINYIIIKCTWEETLKNCGYHIVSSRHEKLIKSNGWSPETLLHKIYHEGLTCITLIITSIWYSNNLYYFMILCFNREVIYLAGSGS